MKFWRFCFRWQWTVHAAGAGFYFFRAIKYWQAGDYRFAICAVGFCGFAMLFLTTVIVAPEIPEDE